VFVDAGPQARGPEVVVGSGRADGADWELVAFESETSGLCVELRRQGGGVEGGALCGVGVPDEAALGVASSEGEWRGLGRVRFLYGPVTREAARIRVESPRGAIEAAVVGKAGRFPVSFYAVRVPAGMPVDGVVAFDPAGVELGRGGIAHD
jgi:hypothetical protein